MKVIVQRVKEAKVVVDSKTVGEISQGYLLYVCFVKGDTNKQVEDAIKKVLNLRIFEDNNGKMNQDISQVEGSILSVSQFTLSWDGKKGNRPSFDQSMPPVEAEIMYEKFNEKLGLTGVPIKKGTFGADMKVHSINDGPVTFILEFN